MDQFDRLLPLLILGVLATILLVLLRRTVRDKPTVSVAAPAPTPVAAEGVRCEATTSVVGVATTVAAAPPAVVRKPRRAPPAPLPAPPRSTIDTVLRLMHDQQSLAAAFLLREIFAPPVSRRAKLPRDR